MTGSWCSFSESDHGRTIGAAAWNPALLKSNTKHASPETLERYLEGDWPSTASVQRRFGSWNRMIDQAELPKNELDRHAPKRAAGDQDGLPIWTGWEMIGPMRERAGIASHAELARRAGLAWGTARAIEVGEQTNPSLRVFLALAVALEVRPALLAHRSVSSSPPERERTTADRRRTAP
jgi:DNA-binding XRE family transcriptional regulator